MLGVGRKPLNFPDGWAPGFSAETVTSLHGPRLPQSRNTLAHVSGKRRASLPETIDGAGAASQRLA